MKLSQLAQEAVPYFASIRGDCEIASLSQDSRLKTESGLFFCISGATIDAHEYAHEAIANGAIALVVTRFIDELNVAQVLVSNDRAAMALMAAAFYQHPARQLRLVGITGTKGKTTTSYFIKAILEYAGYSCGLIGTTGNMIGTQWMKSSLTTPDPIELNRTFRLMADKGVEVVCMEVSAHAINMKRLEGLIFEAGCYMNLSQDHLDYFGSMEYYFETKKSFFMDGKVKNAAINVDDDLSSLIIRDLSIPYSSFGICTNADIFARDIEISEQGVHFQLALWNEHLYPVHLKMMGMFNVYNALAATGLALIMGVEPESICRALEGVKSVPGRAEVLDTHTPYMVILDYSHSPDALTNILKTTKEFARGRVIVLFGCGGDRDYLKRPQMGIIAGQFADYSILTSDNPRTEEPISIIRSIEEGIKQTKGQYEVIEDRRIAINRALTMAEDGDVIILAGKGHETYQDIKGVKRPFDEKQIVRELLSERRKELC
ncbi:MAG: UDP-N-acetylmuramoyl-L-alanyl-D-glutamate--2,6-diaminopimelate ligase [Clostridiales bacterium]|nr:UDP-N-acetylmuramoyl-L-alanyl-D-glutamate--2,6-diaminopimelate ligase [Clostridiales bacterium]